MLVAIFLDLLIGDPKSLPHPVELMGVVINFLQELAERIAKDNKSKLFIGGIIITFIVTFLSGISGWIIERLFLFFKIENPIISSLLFAFVLSSSLASRSLNTSIYEIINLINHKDLRYDLNNIRQKLSFIVGRDVENLDENEILRASAETASENSVDGIFAPLFWMFLGTISWKLNHFMPGPLAMAWIFKASSTIDSMLGYKEGKLKWLGFTGAKLDDLMTWIPSRIVLITLPFCCIKKQSIFKTVRLAWKDGIVDSSPNSGISEAIFAYCAEVRMGGTNYYKGKQKIKPLIAKSYPIANINSVKKILSLSLRLQFAWILIIILITKLLNL
ncbi:adenosylcobinamide-phosphate synthase CbiB [Prochlorococcus marinus]|uniref:Cobalamin biosynthesis protein CobD n=1 Tax=Prochlorococcus marinus XMU1408 TaxID=2213228 RepID=A0A318QWR4_PROMR|nr:adenosylcobinamide-phosphate synthase CbiB [Prochlorococcus marinus]MBW3042495.1 cobalamin biosynthesis protein CobD [Prochlorococcus marinus str. XMU1408]PYE01226.1 cobalamin biosynthesis protein CobD [Prochlorococcus marinus XMU1408]